VLTALPLRNQSHHLGFARPKVLSIKRARPELWSLRLYGEPSAFDYPSIEDQPDKVMKSAFASEDSAHDLGVIPKPIASAGDEDAYARRSRRASILRFQLSPGPRSTYRAFV
jgi:hypothetical protein